jgi:rhamnosyltransferase
MRRIAFESAAAFDQLSPQEKLQACSWDDVSALYRREVLLRLPFQPVMYGEDAIWARDALRSGLTLVYNPAARVYHYHLEDPRFTFQRTILTLCFRFYSFGYRYEVPRLVPPFVEIVARLVMERSLSLRSRMRWFLYNWKRHLASRSAIKAFDGALSSGATATAGLCRSYSAHPPIPNKRVTTASKT